MTGTESGTISYHYVVITIIIFFPSISSNKDILLPLLIFISGSKTAEYITITRIS